MTVQQGFCAKVTVQAGADLSDSKRGTGDLFKAVNAADGTIAETSLVATGLLTETGPLGAGVSVAYQGQLTFIAGAAVAANDQLKVTTGGYLVTADSGDYTIGKAPFSAVASGGEGRGLFDFSNPTYLSV